MRMGTGGFVFEDREHNPEMSVEVRHHRPGGVDETAPVVFFMDGNGLDGVISGRSQYRHTGWRRVKRRIREAGYSSAHLTSLR